MILKSQAMYMYRDKKTAVEVIKGFFKHSMFDFALILYSQQHPTSFEEIPLPLGESQVEVADDYTKRKNVFRVKTDGGSEFLFQVM